MQLYKRQRQVQISSFSSLQLNRRADGQLHPMERPNGLAPRTWHYCHQPCPEATHVTSPAAAGVIALQPAAHALLGQCLRAAHKIAHHGTAGLATQLPWADLSVAA